MRDGSLTRYASLKIPRVVPIDFDAVIRTRTGSCSSRLLNLP